MGSASMMRANLNNMRRITSTVPLYVNAHRLTQPSVTIAPRIRLACRDFRDLSRVLTERAGMNGARRGEISRCGRVPLHGSNDLVGDVARPA